MSASHLHVIKNDCISNLRVSCPFLHLQLQSLIFKVFWKTTSFSIWKNWKAEIGSVSHYWYHPFKSEIRSVVWSIIMQFLTLLGLNRAITQKFYNFRAFKALNKRYTRWAANGFFFILGYFLHIIRKSDHVSCLVCVKHYNYHIEELKNFVSTIEQPLSIIG